MLKDYEVQEDHYCKGTKLTIDDNYGWVPPSGTDTEAGLEECAKRCSDNDRGEFGCKRFGT